MKIPTKQHIYYNSSVANQILSDWNAAAVQIELEYGIWINVHTDEENNILIRIYFEIAGHEFESLKDLKKALEMKVFI